MSATFPLNICVLGGTGFVGRRLIARLITAQHKVCVPTRAPQDHRDLLVLPTLMLTEGDLHNPVYLRRRFQGMDVVVNLVGILNERGHSGKEFARVHAELPAKVAQACLYAGVHRLLHMSALNVSANAPSHYLRTKALGEEAVHHVGATELHTTSFRPAVIFGPGDSFTNRFARLLRLAPGVFPLACPDARLQPVYVEDVVGAFVGSLVKTKTFDQRFDLCGPRSYTLRELVTYLARVVGRNTHIIGLNRRLSWLQAALLEFVPGKPFSLDNYYSLQVDNVCASDEASHATWKTFDIAPTYLEQIVPGYLPGTALGVGSQPGTPKA